LTALRWAAYTPERDLKEELQKTLDLALLGILSR
ncbi:MAG: TetR family transcriptional regulator, partial [Thermus aquaticus]